MKGQATGNMKLNNLLDGVFFQHMGEDFTVTGRQSAQLNTQRDKFTSQGRMTSNRGSTAASTTRPKGRDTLKS